MLVQSGGDTIELRDLPTNLPSGASTPPALEDEEKRLEAEDTRPVNISSLPPVDGGFGAWSFLLAAFFVEGLVWSFPFSFGIFLEAYQKDPTYSSQPKSNLLLPLIGPLSSGIIYCCGPICNIFMDKFPYYRWPLTWIGTVLCGGSLLATSYTTKLPLLVALQGVVYAFGGVLLYYPCISYMTEWFVERRGFANGVIYAGTAFGGVILPLVLPRLIETQGLQKSLRYLAIAIVVLLVPVLPFAKSRVPQLRNHVTVPVPRGGMNKSWLKTKTFWVLIAMTSLQGFGYFVPMVWLPTFSTALNITPDQSAITLALLNGTSFISGVVMGYLSDSKYSPWLLALLNLVFTSITTFVLWGVFSTTFAGVLAFGAVYGLLAGGFSSLWSSCIRPFAREDHRVATVILGYLMLSRGIGNILSTPISTVLLSSSHGQNMNTNMTVVTIGHGGTGYGVDHGKYEKMIVYAGTCFAGAAFVSVAGWLADRKFRARQESDRLAE